jgi:hypothetical protein
MNRPTKLSVRAQARDAIDELAARLRNGVEFRPLGSQNGLQSREHSQRQSQIAVLALTGKIKLAAQRVSPDSGQSLACYVAVKTGVTR